MAASDQQRMEQQRAEIVTLSESTARRLLCPAGCLRFVDLESKAGIVIIRCVLGGDEPDVLVVLL